MNTRWLNLPSQNTEKSLAESPHLPTLAVFSLTFRASGSHFTEKLSDDTITKVQYRPTRVYY